MIRVKTVIFNRLPHYIMLMTKRYVYTLKQQRFLSLLFAVNEAKVF